jgi:hypothetical protein
LEEAYFEQLQLVDFELEWRVLEIDLSRRELVLVMELELVLALLSESISLTVAKMKMEFVRHFV